MPKLECVEKIKIFQNDVINIETHWVKIEDYLDFNANELAQQLADFTSKPVEVTIVRSFIIQPCKKETIE